MTSYARSSTVAKISEDDIRAIRDAGLNRIHIGMESGSDNVLKMIRKGASKDTHIRAGLKVIQAGIELSEYTMPGLGGVKYRAIVSSMVSRDSRFKRVGKHKVALKGK